MTSAMRKTGLDVVGDMAWGSHFCLFYETKEDLLDTTVAYFKPGLESREFCVWVVSEPVTVDEARVALSRAVPDLDRYLAEHSIDIVSARDWYLQGGTFNLKRVMDAWHDKLARALTMGYDGLRVAGDTVWLEKTDWRDFCEYEEALNESFANQRSALLCTYPIGACGAVEVLDVVRTHQFATARRHGSWEVFETAGVKQAKAEINRLNEELEQRVEERTSQLMAASEALGEAQTQLARVTRLTTLGELTVSIAHEVNQPLAAIVTNGEAGLRWLAREPADVGEARRAIERVISDGKRAGDVVQRVRALATKTDPKRTPLKLSDVLGETIQMLRSELLRHRVSLSVELEPSLPPVVGDRVQLQQVLLNLLVNAIEAMSGVEERERYLIVRGRLDKLGDKPAVTISVEDRGTGLPPGTTKRIFDAFYTTKSEGMGLGLAISRSIIEAHGGRLWAESNRGEGATFSFSLPASATLPQHDLG